jgi:hypothetical protein
VSRPVVVITGSRALTDRGAVEAAFVGQLERLDALGVTAGAVFLHGGAKGVDTVVGDLLVGADEPARVEVVRPDWDRHGKAAGFIRNTEMVKRAAATGGAVVAIWDGRSKGTAHTIGEAAKLRVPCFVEVVYP